MTTNSPLVTVLLCTYNDEAFIAETIQSILDQTFADFEFIILNDGSSDGTKEIILSFDDERIRYLEHEENRGLEDGKNWGIDEARGKYIAYIDGDDLSEPDRLRIQSDYMEAHPEIGICASRKTLFGSKNNTPSHVEYDMKIRARALFGTPMEHPSCMVRTEVLRKHNIKYRKNFQAAEDFPFMIDMLAVSQAYCVQIPLIRKRIHDQRISVVKKQIADESAARASQMGFKVLLGVDANADERFAFKRCFFSKSEMEDIATLQHLQSKIIMDDQLSIRELDLRRFVKDMIAASISKLTTTTDKNQSTENQNRALPNEINNASKSFLGTIFSKLRGKMKFSNGKMPVLGIVITQKNESAIINYNIEYHRYLGVSHFYIYDDGSTDDSMDTIPNRDGVHKFYETDYSNIPHELKSVAQKAKNGHWVARQVLNANHALQKAKSHNVDWLFFIDADELVYLDSHEANSFQNVFNNINKKVDIVHFSEVLEYAQTTDNVNIFRAGTFFKTIQYNKAKKRKILDPIRGEMVTIKGFLGHHGGKQAARVNADLFPASSHNFKKRNGATPHVLKCGRLVHYHGCSFKEFVKKNSLPHPSHFVYGDKVPYYPKLFWRDLVQNSGMSQDELRAYFEQWVMFSKEEILELVKISDPSNPMMVEFKDICEIWDTMSKRKSLHNNSKA